MGLGRWPASCKPDDMSVPGVPIPSRPISNYPRLWQKAANLAAALHAGQVSRHGDTEYIAHPVRVALLVTCEFRCEDPEVISASLLHDCLEKTDLEVALLRQEMGGRVAEMVEALSKNRGGPEAAYWNRLTAASWEVRLIKIADALDHMDCLPGDLEHRIQGGNQALALAFTEEEPLQRAKQCLKHALEQASLRSKAGAAGADRGD